MFFYKNRSFFYGNFFMLFFWRESLSYLSRTAHIFQQKTGGISGGFDKQGGKIMHMITFTKKKIKRLTAIGILAAATAAAGIGAIVTSVGTQASERRIPVYSVERGDNKISLTFDVAWENSNTQQLIDILDEYDARATFFVTGDWCDRYPEDVRMFAEAGHEIQNHSDQHPHVKGMNVNELITDSKAASSKIKDITGREPTLYRAPYGEYDDTVITTVEGMGMTVIQWDVDSLDWKKPDPDAITKKVVNSVKSGSIVLFHNDLENTTEALPQILEQLSAKGYEFIPVSELIYTENYSIDSNGMQIPAVQSNTEITPENVEEVMAEYSDKLHSAGFTDEQMALAAQAVKNGAEIPAEVYEALAQMTMADSAPDTAQTAETSAPESAPNGNAAAK